MRRSMIGAVLALGAVTIQATAYAAGHAADAPVNWQSRTCKAAIAYSQHPTKAGLDAVLADARHYGQQLLSGPVVQSYKSADVLDMLATERSPSKNAPKYIPRDIRYIAQDCLS